MPWHRREQRISWEQKLTGCGKGEHATRTRVRLGLSTHHGWGTLYSQTGQAEQACTELSTAIEMYRDMEMTFWLPETEAALAEVEKR